MADPPVYRVIVSGVVLPEKSRAEVIDKLVLLFHSRRDTMEKLLQGKAVPLTREYGREQAEKICRAIREAGAECRMEEVGAPEVSPPEAEPAVSPEAEQSDSVADAQFSPEQEHQAHHQDYHDEAEDEADPQNEEQESALMRFVAVNTDYYRRQFARFGGIERPSFALSWHWPAFFLFFFWAVYRKLWLWAGVNLAGGVVLALMVKPGLVYLAWMFFWPLTANYWYFRHAASQVLRRGDDAADTDDERAESGSVLTGGGVSRGAVWLGLIVMFLFSAALNNLITERMLERYSERVGDVLPDPGSRQRGDGSAIDDVTTLTPKAAQTVDALGVLSMTLKLAASGKGRDDSQLALSVFRRVIEQKQIKDAWGKKINLRQDAAGQVTLVSAGPDGRFDSGDDILQFIRFDDL